MRRAFTLTELAVLLGILGFFALLLAPTVFNGNGRYNARRYYCQSNLKQIGLAFLQYVQDVDGYFPPTQTSSTSGWADSIQPYTKGWPVFQCRENGNGRDTRLTDYFYNKRLSAMAKKNVPSPSLTILGGDGDFDAPTNTALSSLPKAWRDDENSPAFRHLHTSNYLFADGHARSVKAKSVIEQKPKLYDYTYSFLP